MFDINIETISRICIKPSSPTPPDLKILKLSLLDQISPDLHANMTFFYPPNNTAADEEEEDDHHHDVISQVDRIPGFLNKSQILQKSLSQTLTHFYPFAGRFKDESTVDCNDDGIIFIESKTDTHLSKFLNPPDFATIKRRFLPTNDPQTLEMWKGSLLLVRFTLFGCGGTAITFSTSHKIMDLTSFVTLLQSWISACSGTTPTVLPDLHIGSSRLPSILDMSQMPTSVVLSTKKLTSRRLLFSAFKVRELKTKVFNAFRDQEFSYYPSRVEVVTAFLWKFALEAFISTRKETTFRPSVFIQAVNVRPRMEPPLPQNAIGNLAWLFPVIVENEKDMEFIELVKKLMAMRVSLKNKVNEFRGEGIVEAVKEGLKIRKEILMNKNDLAVYICASWCKFSLYETDFGWGKPAWMTSVVDHLMTNTIHLLDTKEVDGVEALVHLDEEEMKIFENNEELLKYTSINPSVSVI